LRLSITIIIVIVGCGCCKSSSALLSLQDVPSKDSRGALATPRPNFFQRRLLGPNHNTKNNDHDTRHNTASLLFMTDSMTPSTTTKVATTSTKTNRFASSSPDNGRNGDYDDDDDDDRKKNNDQAAAEASHSSSRQRNFNKQWIVMYEKLKAYKEMYGNCLVPYLYVCDDGTRLGRWVKHQRQLNVKDAELRVQRRQALDDIGFCWVVNERIRQPSPVTGGVHASQEDRFNARWNAMFEKLKEYKAEYGDCLVPQRYNCTDGTPLGQWVANQRNHAATDSDMTPLRRRTLDKIGFVWQVQVRDPSPKLDEQWNEKFRLLQEYHAEHGDCLVPTVFISSKNKIRLGMWVKTQRASHAAGKLREDRLIRLESLDFSFRALPDESMSAQWKRMLEQLTAYRQRHGDCRVPYDEPELGSWVNGIRSRQDTLSTDQRAALDALGFMWDVFDSHWQAQFDVLERFQKQHGHCLVTKKHEADYPGLLSWLRTQRKRRERGGMDGEQIKRLDAIGFIWSVSDTKWQAQFAALQRFQIQHGHCLVTKKHEAEYPGLPRWLDFQRTRRKLGHMDGERIQQLESVGFSSWGGRRD
jgi:sugar phosphate isomerase/epimerase